MTLTHTRSRTVHRRVLTGAAAGVLLLAAACAPAGSSSASSSSSSSASSSASSSGAGTSSSSGSGGSATGSATGTQTGGSSSGGTVVVARTGDVDQLDPQKATAFQTVETLSLVYGRLVALDQDGKVVPDLATKWTTSADGKTLTFTLRSGVTWQDGDPFTADDVKASLQRILDEKTAAVARSNLSSITKIDAADGTVTLTLSAPSTALLYSLASVNAAILHDKDIQANTVAKTPDGTGPFSWKSWAQGQQVVLAANPAYWAGAPKIGTVQFRVIPAESSIVSGMKAGAFQIGLLSNPTVADNAGSSDRFQLVKQPTLAYHALMLNGRRGPLQKLEVRQAIACAVDRDQVVKTAANGDGTVTGPITSPGFSYSPTEGLPCTPGDTAAAKKMLADAGYPDGFSLHTIVETGEYATAVAEGQNLQAQLKAIGVTLDLQQLTTDPYVKAWLAADFDAAVALNGGSYDPYLMYGRYFTQGGSLSGPAGLESPTLASLLVKGNTSTDDAQRQTTYRDLQQELLKESPWVWLFRSQDFYLVGSGVSFTPRADGLLSSLAAS